MNKKGYKIEIRTACKVCGGPLPKRFRTFCSKKCRFYAINQRHKEAHKEWHRREREKLATESEDKVQCLICGRWYRHVGIHIFQTHKITAREYREAFGFDVKKGQLPPDLRKRKSEYVLQNGTMENLKKGIKYRFEKGQEGVGIYNRSAQTLERLKVLHKNKKLNTSK